MMDEDTKVIDVKVTRDKAAEPGTAWAFTLQGVPQVKRGAVVVPATNRDGSPFRPGTTPWWTFDLVDLPDAIRKLTGRAADVARDAYRVMAWVDDRDGLTAEQVYAAIKERPGEAPSAATMRAGFARLKSEGIAVQGATPARFVISDHFAPSVR
jgi:hypothetical protein